MFRKLKSVIVFLKIFTRLVLSRCFGNFSSAVICFAFDFSSSCSHGSVCIMSHVIMTSGHLAPGSLVTFRSFLSKLKKIFQNQRLRINKIIIPFALVGYEIGYSELDPTGLVGYLPSHIQQARME